MSDQIEVELVQCKCGCEHDGITVNGYLITQLGGTRWEVEHTFYVKRESLLTALGLEKELALARQVIEAARIGPCRHTADIGTRVYDCPLCVALAAYDALKKG